MTIYLYNLLTDPRVVDKSLYLSPVSGVDGYDPLTGMTGMLRNRCSMVDPVITLQIKSADVTKFNYIHVADWSRYYYIRNITVEQNDLITITCHIDVLYSYMSAIKNLTALVSRTETNQKPFLTDARRPLSQNETQSIILPTSGAGSFNPKGQLASNVSYVLLTANNPGVGGTASYTNNDPNLIAPGVAYSGDALSGLVYAMSRSKLEAFFGEFYNESWTNILKSIMGQSADGITDVISYPFNVPAVLYSNPEAVAINMFNHAMTTTGYKLVSNPYVTFDFGTFVHPSTDYIHREPYTRAVLYLPYVGEVDISMLTLNHGISVKYQVALTTGDAVVSVTDNVTGVYIHTSTAQIGIHIPVTRTNNVEQARNNLLTGAQAFGAIANPNTAQGLSVIGNSLIKMGLNTTHISADRPASMVSRMMRYDPYIRITQTDDLTPTNYGHFVGYPFNDIVQLSTLSGYTVIGEVFGHMSFAQEDEQDEIFRLLKSGIIL